MHAAFSFHRSTHRVVASLLLAAATACNTGGASDAAPPSTDYQDLVTLFTEWRKVQAPPMRAGVPDYSAPVLAEQRQALERMRARLAAIDPSKWPVPQQVDYEIVKAEMNGLDFDHRVLQPWARNPAYYVSIFPSEHDVPAREGPVAPGTIELWQLTWPLTAASASDLATRLATVGPRLAAARQYLTGNGRDLWTMGIRALKDQGADLASLKELASEHPNVVSAANQARAATDSFVTWLEQQAPSKTGPSGIGIENYDWYLANVHLVPFTWEEQVALMRRELARAHAALRLEEHRNRTLPAQGMIASAAEYDRRMNAGVSEYMAFLQNRQILTVQPWMDSSLRARIGRFTPPESKPREFFAQVDYRDPVVMRTHGFHWIDKTRAVMQPHQSPIRRGPLLYNIFDGRAEGMATGMEEMMMHAGLFDAQPRSRELIWILLAQRAARALGDLMMHANIYTIDEAVAFASEWTPRGWLPRDGNTVWGEQHLYLQQPVYGTSYLIGKIEIEDLIAARAAAQGEAFTLRGFMDEFTAAGIIPVSLIRWELTGSRPAMPRGKARQAGSSPSGS